MLDFVRMEMLSGLKLGLAMRMRLTVGRLAFVLMFQWLTGLMGRVLRVQRLTVWKFDRVLIVRQLTVWRFDLALSGW